ncbi:guanine nucleotide-binding protein subunit beta-like protein 1 [Cloeon dipterum]|uniref:guanine nucleotide-binding protein subunit beta-like protein 1 n=1 Tax=Cloeon dipterum TaxID=197152 RepID=UPI00321F90FB
MAAPPDPIYSFRGNQSQVHCLNFLLKAGSEKLISGTRTGHVFVWDLPTKSLSDSFLTGDGTCISVLVPDKQDYFLTHNRSDCVKKWTDWKCTLEFKTKCLQYCAAKLLQAPASRAQLVAFPGGEERSIQVASFEQEERVVSQMNYPGSAGNIMSLSDAGAGRVLALFEAGDLLLWDLRNPGKPQGAFRIDLGADDTAPSAAMCLAFSAPKSLGVVGSSDNTLHPFALDAGGFRTLPSTKITNEGTSHLCFRPDQKILAAACWDSKVRLFSARSIDSKTVFRPLAVLPTLVEDKSVSCVTFSDKPVESFGGKTILAAAGDACSILLWDIYN